MRSPLAQATGTRDYMVSRDKVVRFLVIALLAPLAFAGGDSLDHVLPTFSFSTQADCTPINGVEFICGPRNVEDMVEIPDSNWIIGAGTGWDIYAINAKNRGWFPMEITYVQESESAVFTACPSPRDPANSVNHGIGLRVNTDRPDELYVVNHTTRESVEVFDVVFEDHKPALRWKGCLPTPGAAFGNSVVPLPDGGIAVTVTVDVNDPESMADFVAGKVSGYVLVWHSDAGWRRMKGSDLAGNNGIVVSDDGQQLFVGGYGDGTLARFNLDDVGSITNIDTVKIPFDRADNIRWSPRGTLLVTGHNGSIEQSNACVVAYDTICGQDYGFLEMDPSSLEILKVVNKQGSPEFGSATTVLEVNDFYWIGTFRGDRVGVLPARLTSKDPG